jgi:hypothetical protein|tara:strand:+ start:249 stop:416 length:168 start_codon:yes stop_codon:yes gene_type:complete
MSRNKTSNVPVGTFDRDLMRTVENVEWDTDTDASIDILSDQLIELEHLQEGAELW